MRRHLTLLLVLPTVMISIGSAHAQSDRFYHFDNKQDSVPIWTKQFADSLAKEFNASGFNAPLWPNQEQKEYVPQYPFPEYFANPRLPGVPLPDLRNQQNGQSTPRLPKRRDGKEIPHFPGWRIEKLKNLAKA